MSEGKRISRKPVRRRAQSAALRRLVDELTAERYRPVPPPPGLVHDPGEARARLAEALRPARPTRRGQP